MKVKQYRQNQECLNPYSNGTMYLIYASSVS